MRFLTAVAVLGTALSGCSGVRHYTYEIELTTDRQPHNVELWVEPAEGYSGGEWLAYAVTFPQRYYAYRDNHNSLKQTTIGLLLDRRTLRPLTEVIASETGLSEGLELPAWKEGLLKKAAFGPYADRQLFVTIRGRTAPGSAPSDPAKTYDEMYDKVGKQADFTVYKVRHGPNYPDRGLPEIVGFATGTPDLRVHCLPAVARCSLDQPYRDSTISISVGRAHLVDGPALMIGIRKILDRHLS